MVLFKPITQRIADYLNMDGKLKDRKLLFIILNLTSSGGLVGIALLGLVAWYGAITVTSVFVVFLFIVVLGLIDSLTSFNNVEIRHNPPAHPKMVVPMCLVPFIAFLLLAEYFLLARLY